MGRGGKKVVWMLIAVNTACCGGSTARSAVASPAAPETAENHDQDTSLPDAGDVVMAYGIARRWIDTFDPPRADDEASAVAINNAHGICVLLRHRGRLIGTGQDNAGDDLMLRRAVGRAMSQALGDPAIENLSESERDRIGGALSLELDVAGPFIPLPGRTFGQIAARLEPAIDGVALRTGRRWAISYPAQMQATNAAANLPGIMGGLAATLGFTVIDLREIQQQSDVTVYRFRTVHLAQRAPDAFPHQAQRCGEPILVDTIDEAGLAGLARRLLVHLQTRRWPRQKPAEMIGDYVPPPGIKGDYHPVADRYEPIAAPLLDQALAAFALLRCGVAIDEPETGRDASSFALDILRDMTRLDEASRDELNDPVAAAAIVYALCEVASLEDEPALLALLTRSLGRITECVREDGHLRQPMPDGRLVSIDPHGQALIAGALARARRCDVPERPDDATVRTAIEATWESLPEHRHIALLPWIGWAETDKAHGVVGPAPRLEHLEELRRVLEKSRIKPSESEPDLVGGFALTAGRPGSAPRATAQSFRPAAWMAGLLADRSLIGDDEYETAMRGHMLSIRFLAQLMVSDDSEWRFRSPERTSGGVRAAPWDHDQPLAAQAMALLTAAETLRAVSGRRQP